MHCSFNNSIASNDCDHFRCQNSPLVFDLRASPIPFTINWLFCQYGFQIRICPPGTHHLCLDHLRSQGENGGIDELSRGRELQLRGDRINHSSVSVDSNLSASASVWIGRSAGTKPLIFIFRRRAWNVPETTTSHDTSGGRSCHNRPNHIPTKAIGATTPAKSVTTSISRRI